MNLKQFWSVLLMSVLIIVVGTMVAYIRDEVFAQTQFRQNSLPAMNVPVQAQPPKWLVSFERLDDQNVQQIIIIDPETQRIAVYRVGLDNGQIHIFNIRHINPDLQLRVFDAPESTPAPQYIEQHFLRNRNNQ